MLVNVCDHLIDTTKISSVSKVTCSPGTNYFFVFHIITFNRGVIPIYFYPKFDKVYDYTSIIGIPSPAELDEIQNLQKRNEVIRLEAEQKINKVRDTLIEYWNKDKSTIPEINF